MVTESILLTKIKSQKTDMSLGHHPFFTNLWQPDANVRTSMTDGLIYTHAKHSTTGLKRSKQQ